VAALAVPAVAGMDAPGFRGAAQLAAIVRRYPLLERIACGHMHRPIVTRWGGTVAMTVPSVAHQLTLDLRSDVAETFSLEPPAFALHLWDNGALVSHVALVDRADGPYPFHDAGALID
jgi:hypothetical protein